MTTDTTGKAKRNDRLYGGFIILMLANIVLDRWKPGSTASLLARYAFMGIAMTWFVLKSYKGYRRRRPFWNRDSWVRYFRLAALPVLSVIVVLALSTEWGMNLTRNVQGATRTVYVSVLVVMLLLGAVGLGAAQDWLHRGEASEQFTRRRWFQRRKSSATAS